MLYKRLAGAAMALAAMGLGVLLLASPAQATDGHLPVAPWAANGESSVVDATTVKLQDHVTGNTSIENPSVGLNVAAGAEISVEYELMDGATCETGEPRLFAITNGTLDKSELCDGTGDGATSGVLSFETSSAGLVTQVGLVYSRATGHVVMSNLTVDGRLVLFAEPPALCEVEGLGELLADDEKCQEPSPSPSVSVSPSPVASESPEASESPAPGIAGGVDGGDQLPLTGSGLALPLLAIAGVLLVGGGAAVAGSSYWRRRSIAAVSE